MEQDERQAKSVPSHRGQNLLQPELCLLRVLAEIAIQEQIAQQTSEQARKAEQLRMREEEEQQLLRDAVCRVHLCPLLPPLHRYGMARPKQSAMQPWNEKHT